MVTRAKLSTKRDVFPHILGPGAIFVKSRAMEKMGGAPADCVMCWHMMVFDYPRNDAIKISLDNVFSEKYIARFEEVKVRQGE